MQKILVMGLPGAGKTTLAKELKGLMERDSRTVGWLNADEVRKAADDWDFSESGRIRQSHRMADAANDSTNDYVIADFVAPLAEMRDIFDADWIVWVDSIDRSRYEDTNKAFVEPDVYDFRIPEQDAIKWAAFIWDHMRSDRRRPVFDWQKETTLLLGRYQPWHDGHRALFERAVAKTGQIIIQVRDCQGWNDSNPFDFEKVRRFIKRDLDPMHQGKYEIQLVPNIVNVTYGRDVGYKIEQEVFDDATHSISATDIRKQMGLA